jgi:hypothetical protein
MTISSAMKALDWIAGFVRTEPDKYCLLQNALPVVLREIEQSIRTKRGGRFHSFAASHDYLQENAALGRMVPFWQNVYYQFGLIAMTLHHPVRPCAVAVWKHLRGCCETVARAAQGVLYADYDDWQDRWEEDLHRYQDGYNTRHGTLRWFADDDERYLHVDIRRLDSILTICATRDYDITRVEENILKKVFGVQGRSLGYVRDYVELLVNADEEDEDDYARLWQVVSAFRWEVNRDAEKTYSNIYRDAVNNCGDPENPPRMMFVEAVDAHRRYATRAVGSIFW